MIIIAVLIGLAIISFVTFIIVNARRGSAISVHLHQFDNTYDAVLAESGSKLTAMQQAAQVFKSCPRLKLLTNEELAKVALILSRADDPKKIIDTIVLKLDSKKIVQALRDEAFLMKLVNASVEEPVPGTKETLIKSTRDQTWRTHIQTAEKIEDFMLGDYRVVFLKVKQQSSSMHYHYRLIVFPFNKHEPVLSLNLESNPLAGTCCLGAHVGNGHDNLGFADKNMSAKDFKVWGIENAKRYLGLTNRPHPTPEARINMSEREGE